MGPEHLFTMDRETESRWASFENPEGEKGAGGRANRGAKGSAFRPLPHGGSHVLASLRGCGIIRQLWMTFSDRSPAVLRGVRLDMFWDDSPTPAVSVPVADFFGSVHGLSRPFENAYFMNPEGRSQNVRIPMPFRKAARIVVTNESGRDIELFFYDVQFTLHRSLPDEALYFQAHWRRENPTTVGRDFQLLPQVRGAGRFLGCHVGVIEPPEDTGWFGEGEFKAWIDGDGEWPTIVGTGTEDYIGTAWGQGEFIHREAGCWKAGDTEAGKDGVWSFYRYHTDAPIYFQQEIRIALQQIGGRPKADVLAMRAKERPMEIITIGTPGGQINLMEKSAEEREALLADPVYTMHTNYYRSDDVCAVAMFFLDRPEGALPPLGDPAERLAGLPGEE